MWDVLVRTPRGSTNPRKLLMLLATFFVACFGYIAMVAPTAYAAPDATWDGDNISYQSNTYAPAPSDLTPPSDIQAGSAIYQYVDKSKTPNLVYFIYFSPTTADPKSAKEATYIRYTLNPPNRYINPTGKKTITVAPAEEPATPSTDDGALSSSCTIDGIGWIVCPLMNGISEGMDFIYERIQGFLSVQPITTSVDNPIYRIWVVSRDLANIAFIIGFMVIIYSYLVGGGFSGYEIRKIMPRLVLAAVLINVSYIICAAAVDISNIAGHGVNQLFENVRDTALPGSSTSADLNWTSVTAWVLAGGTGAVAGALFLPGAVGGAAGLWLMLATFLFGAALVVMVTFLILAARQAIIIVLIAIAPLAFAAYILPNTEKWFEKWRSLFFTMLVMFPAFGAVFGGAQLAGEVIIRTATGIEQIILGLGVMVAPLAITPLLLKLGGGVLNRIGGIINNRQKGMYDRVKNHNEERRQQHIARHNALNAERRANGDFGGRRFNPRTMVRRRAATNYARKNYRDEQKKQDEEAAGNYWHRQTGRWGYDNHFEHDNFAERTNARNRIGIRQDGFGNLDAYKRHNSALHDYTEAQHEEHWQNRLNGAAGAADRAMLTDTRMSQGRAKVISGAFEAQDELTLQAALNTNPGYAGLRAMKVQTSVDTGVADIHKAAMEATGKLALSNTVNADRALRQMKVETYETEKRSETIDNTLKKNAEAHWDYVSRTDAGTQELRLREVQATDKAKLVQEQWNSLVENIAAKGAAAPNVAPQSAVIANSIMGTRGDIQIEGFVQESAKRTAQAAMSGQLKKDATLRMRAGGIGGADAATRIYAKAKSDVVGAYLEDVKASRSILTEYSLQELLTLQMEGKDREGNDVKKNDALRDAALQEIMLAKGNNWSYQKLKDRIAIDHGMIYDDRTNEYFEVQRDAQGNAILGPNRQPLRGAKITDQDRIDRNRDVQQMLGDAVKNSKLVVKNLSGTDRGNLEVGTFALTGQNAILRDIQDKKINASRLAGTDIDELMHMVQVLRDDNARNSLPDSARQALAETIEQALTDPRIRESIAEREAEMMGVIHNYVSDLRPTIPLADKQRYESYAETPVSTNYDINTVFNSGGFGPR